MDYFFQKQMLKTLDNEQLQKALKTNKVCEHVGGPIIEASIFRDRVSSNLKTDCRWPMDLDEIYSVNGKSIQFKGNVND